jgi:hypothetical protein
MEQVYEFLTWVSVAATAITFAAFMGGLFRLARWSQSILENWLLLIHTFWKTVLFFAPHVAKLDAVVLTFSGLLATSMLRSRRSKQEEIAVWHIVFAIIAVICLSLCFSMGLLDAFSKDTSERSFVREYNDFILSVVGRLGMSKFGLLTIFELNVASRQSVQLLLAEVCADFLMLLTLLAVATTPALLLHKGRISVLGFSYKISSVMLVCGGILLFSMLASWLDENPYIRGLVE